MHASSAAAAAAAASLCFSHTDGDPSRTASSFCQIPRLVHDACRDAVGDFEGVDLFEAQVQLAVERLARAPAENKPTHTRTHTHTRK